MQRLPFPLKLWPIPQSQYLSFSAALLDATQHAGVTQESIIKDDPAFILNVCCPCFPLQSVRAPSATLHQRTPRATTTSPSTATSRDTTTCRPSAAPPPPGEHLSDCQSEFSPPDFGDEFRPVLAKRKSKLSALLWQSEQQWGSCHTEEPLFTVDAPPPPFSTQHRPSVGQSGTRFTVTDLSSRQAVVRKAGLWRRQRGFSCAHLPWEKHSRRSLRLKAATWECSCVWTHPNGLQLKFSTYSACCRSAV